MSKIVCFSCKLVITEFKDAIHCNCGRWYCANKYEYKGRKILTCYSDFNDECWPCDIGKKFERRYPCKRGEKGEFINTEGCDKCNYDDSPINSPLSQKNICQNCLDGTHTYSGNCRFVC